LVDIRNSYNRKRAEKNKKGGGGRKRERCRMYVMQEQQ